MKKTWRGRVLAMLLVLALTVGLLPAALAADSSTPVTFKQVSNDTLGTPVRPDLAVGEVSALTSSAPTTSGEKNCPSRSFRDLDTTKWYHEAIDTMLNEGLMNGTGNGLFEPNATLTRAMLVTILWRSEGKPTAADPTPFTMFRRAHTTPRPSAGRLPMASSRASAARNSAPPETSRDRSLLPFCGDWQQRRA